LVEEVERRIELFELYDSALSLGCLRFLPDLLTNDFRRRQVQQLEVEKHRIVLALLRVAVGLRAPDGQFVVNTVEVLPPEQCEQVVLVLGRERLRSV
jgi:hypothetical protein